MKTLEEILRYTKGNLSKRPDRPSVVCMWGTRDECVAVPLAGEMFCARHLLVWRANHVEDKGD